MTDQIKYLAGYQVQSMQREQLAGRLLSAVAQHQKKIVLFANANFVVQCRAMRNRINQPDCILVNDGIGMDIAARLIQGGKFAENLNGTDFTPYLFQSAPQPLKVFMIGAKPEVLALAVNYVREQLKQDVVGSCDGYAGLRDAANISEQINRLHPDIILVALGNPFQEKWIFDHVGVFNSGVVMGVGALFDFWSGGKVRAPLFIQKMKLEWLFRLAQEPRRLTRRYTIDIGVFLYHCFKYR